MQINSPSTPVINLCISQQLICWFFLPSPDNKYRLFSLHIINRLVFIMDMYCVLCEVETELHIIYIFEERVSSKIRFVS
jgi:hypothetical protein